MHICDNPDGTATTIEDSILSYLDNKDINHRQWRQKVDDSGVASMVLPSLTTSLEREAIERDEPNAVGFVTIVKTCYFAILLSFVLPHINCLSLLFQAKSVDITLTLAATIEVIKGYCCTDLKEAKTQISGDLSDINIIGRTNAI